MPSSKLTSHKESQAKTKHDQSLNENVKDTQDTQDTQDSAEKLKMLLESNESLPINLKEALIKHLDKTEQNLSQSNSDSPKDHTSLISNVLSQIKQTPVQVIDKVSTRVNQTVDTIRNDKLEQVKSEVRRWVDQVDLQAEAVRLLSQLSIELKTSIRLVADQESKLGLKPEVNTKAQLKWGEDLDKKETSATEDP